MKNDGKPMKPGQNAFAKRGGNLKVPIGIEKVLCRAAGDEEFKALLLKDRKAALETWDAGLSEIELGVLNSVPNESLAAMISRIDLKKHTKRRFMKAVATATFVATAAAGAAFYLSTPGCTGADPDMPFEDTKQVDMVPADKTSDAPAETADVVEQDVLVLDE